MTTYRYAAARADGATVRGYLDAASAHDAAALVSARGLFPTAVAEAERPPRVTRRASARAAGTALRSLASLVGVGVPLHRALDVTARLVPEPLAGGLAHVEARVRERHGGWGDTAKDKLPLETLDVYWEEAKLRD